MLKGSRNEGKGRRIVILGGGYAALAAVGALARLAPESRVTLIAPRKAHIRITQLQETLRYSLRRLCVPYSDLGKRFGFRFSRICDGADAKGGNRLSTQHGLQPPGRRTDRPVATR